MAAFALATAPSLVAPSAAWAVGTPYDPYFAAPTTATDYGAGTRPLGVAVADFDGDTYADIVAGRVSAGAAVITFQKGGAGGTFAAPAAFPWRLQTFNQWTLRAGDLNGDSRPDLIWGSNAAVANSGCTVSPIPAGQTCATAGGTTVTVNPGEVRVLYGNGTASVFDDLSYYVSGVRFAGGALLGDIGTATGTIAAANIDGDTDVDVVAGGIDGTSSVIKVLTNNGGGAFAMTTLVSQLSATSGDAAIPTYFPAINATTSPWGLAFGDADGDGDNDLWIGDRALYVYLYKNNGSGAFTLTPGSTVVSGTRPNVYLAHESFRAAVGFTPSLASADYNGDSKADLVLGLQSGTNTPTTGCPVNSVQQPCAHDGELVLDVSAGTAHTTAGVLADIGTLARGVSAYDVNGDSNTDVVAGEYDGKVKVLRQLPPLDTDNDGISDYVDNAPTLPNRPRIDMNTDGSYNAADQLDNDFDTVRGDPENSGTWQRLGDPADPDDDNDGPADGSDNCVFTANADQADKDGDGVGDACDPLFDSDVDADGVPAFDPDDPMYARAQAAAAKWSEGDTHFVIRIDALGRFFQNEFTGLMSDAAVSSPATWPTTCQGMYTPGTDPDPGCGSLGGGKQVPLTTVVIPRLLWTDPEVVTWINDRNDNPLFEVGQHGTYHNSGPSNTELGDWAGDPDKGGISCDVCGLTLAESYELMKVGQDTLLGNYGNKWIVDSGATGASPKVDWTTSANPLISFAPPYNTSDTTAREAIAQLGYKAFSASVFEEGYPTPTTFSSYFTPEGSHHEQFDQFGMFHASADRQLDPIAVPDETYDQADRDDFAGDLVSATQDGGLNTWLIEEVEWSGRPCNEVPRLTTNGCNGGGNRENNTVYGPRWEQWLQLLDYVKSYPGGVAMTMGEVGLAKAFDNAPTVPNADQADSDHDGVGDVIDGAALAADDTTLSRNVAGSLTATLANGDSPLADQDVTFSFDADGNGTDESYAATTGADGAASVSVTATRDIGPASFSVSWDGGTTTASDTGSAEVGDATTVTLDAGNPATGQVTDAVSVGATLTDSDDVAVEGATLTFTIGGASGSATTDATGHAQASVTLVGPAAVSTVVAAFAGGGGLGSSSASHSFTIAKESTSLGLAVTAGPKSTRVLVATLSEADGARLTGRTISFETTTKVRSHTVTQVMGSAVTDGQGVARFTVPSKYLSSTPRPVTARFAGDTSYLATSASATVTR